MNIQIPEIIKSLIHSNEAGYRHICVNDTATSFTFISQKLAEGFIEDSTILGLPDGIYPIGTFDCGDTVCIFKEGRLVLHVFGSDNVIIKSKMSVADFLFKLHDANENLEESAFSGDQIHDE